MSEQLDLVVCGGGITGAGIARDAALRGLHVALLEKGDFASGTSSRSSKLIHGGLRYLQHGHLRLVFESTAERALLAKLAPHLVRPLPFLIPTYRNSKPGFLTLDSGLWLYDALAVFRAPRLHRTYRAGRVRILEPTLASSEITGGLEYCDCTTDDARLVLENILHARELGAVVRSHTRLTGVSRDGHGRIVTVHARSEIDGEELELHTRLLIVAAGPWTDEVLAVIGTHTDGASTRRPLLRPTKGIHIVLERERLPLSRALTLFTDDARVVFCLPWNGRIVVGTTDTDYAGSPDSVAADATDVRYLCDQVNKHVSLDQPIDPVDVLATWAGIRPLIAPLSTPAAVRTSEVPREHAVMALEPGLLAIAGGKLTTYRRMACEAV
ncbi:MAG: glycerol-3-phosphate dehydrogenase/oxidase, partial [Pseudomonadota bacterium]